MMIELRTRSLALLLTPLLAACRSPSVDPAPPVATYELASAAPGALGALAAGTDAAPPRPSEGVLGEADEGDEAEPEVEPDADAGADSGGDAGLAADAGAGVAL